MPRTHITTLNLSVNSIGDEGLKALATVLPRTHITTLNFSWNHIGDQGDQYLEDVAVMLSCNSERKLELSKICDILSNEDTQEIEYIIASNNLVEFAITHEIFAQKIINEFINATRFKEAKLILLSLPEDVRASLFEDLSESFSSCPFPALESGPENLQHYQSLLDSLLRIYSAPEQRLKLLEGFTATCNDYAIKETCSLLLSEAPDFLKEKLSDLIEFIPQGFTDSADLQSFYESLNLAGALADGSIDTSE